MLVHLCDHCHEEIGECKYTLGNFLYLVKNDMKHSVHGKEFCTLQCLHNYLLDGLRGRGWSLCIKK